MHKYITETPTITRLPQKGRQRVCLQVTPKGSFEFLKYPKIHHIQRLQTQQGNEMQPGQTQALNTHSPASLAFCAKRMFYSSSLLMEEIFVCRFDTYSDFDSDFFSLFFAENLNLLCPLSFDTIVVYCRSCLLLCRRSCGIVGL